MSWLFVATLTLIAGAVLILLMGIRYLNRMGIVEELARSPNWLHLAELTGAREPTTFVRNTLWILFIGMLAYSFFFSTVFDHALQYELNKPVIEMMDQCGVKDGQLILTFTNHTYTAKCSHTNLGVFSWNSSVS